MATKPRLLPEDEPIYKPIAPAPPGGLLASVVGTAQQPQPPANNVQPIQNPQTFAGPSATQPTDPRLYENDNVEAALLRLTSSGSDYIRQAEAAGRAQAARRGLLNSSIAAGTARAAAIQAAAPLAMQEAQQRSTRNQVRLDALYQDERLGKELQSRADLQAKQIESTEKIAQQEIASREAMLGRQLTSEEMRQVRELASREAIAQLEVSSRESIAGADISSRERMSAAQIASAERLGFANIASEEARLGRQLSSQERQTIMELASRETIAGAEIGSRERISAAELANRTELTLEELAARERIANNEIAAAEARLGRQLDSEERRQVQELATRAVLTREGYQSELERTQIGEAGATARANLDAATRTQLQAMQNLSESQRATLNYYLESNRQYAQSLDNLYANQNMPAPARDQAIQNFTALRNSQVNLPAVIYGTNLNWGNGQTAPTTPPPGTSPEGLLGSSNAAAGPQPNAQGLYNPAEMIYRNGRFYHPVTGQEVQIQAYGSSPGGTQPV